MGIGYTELDQSNWHAQDLWLGTGLFGELRGFPGWVAIPTAECKSQNGGDDLGWT